MKLAEDCIHVGYLVSDMLKIWVLLSSC